MTHGGSWRLQIRVVSALSIIMSPSPISHLSHSHCVHVDDALIVDVLSVCGRRLRALRLVGCGKLRYIRQTKHLPSLMKLKRRDRKTSRRDRGFSKRKKNSEKQKARLP
jgi:hypothetical protein